MKEQIVSFEENPINERITYDEKNKDELIELFKKNVESVHIENMNKNHFFMCIKSNDKEIRIDFLADGDKINAYIEKQKLK